MPSVTDLTIHVLGAALLLALAAALLLAIRVSVSALIDCVVSSTTVAHPLSDTAAAMATRSGRSYSSSL